MSAPATTVVPERNSMTRPQAVSLMFASTILAAIAQVLIKIGANSLSRSHPLAMLTNIPLISGYSLYGLFTIFFVYALRDEELSFVYPIISLSYVWVTALSIWVFHEAMNPFKILGIATIVFGVCILGRDVRK